MKNTLGKTVIILFTLIASLCANSNLATFQLSTNNKTPYIKEAVEITFIATQKDKSDVMFFFLKPRKSSNYKIVLLNKDAKELAYHHKKTTFTYLLFPLKDTDIKVNFDFTIKVASDKAVAQVYEGSRDNVKWIETINTKITLKPLLLNVKSLKEPVDLIGDFHISSSLDKNSINSYENANITYTLTGIGYDNFTINPIGTIENVNVFSDISKFYERATSKGYQIRREFSYALLSENNINIQSNQIKCYSPTKESYYTINTKEYKIKVTKLDKSNLVDKENFPKTTNDFSYLKNIFIYFLIFSSGFLTAKLSPRYFKQKSTKYVDIKSSSTPKELLYLLMHKYSNKGLEVHYEALNNIVYNGASKSQFNKIKKEVIQKLENS